MRFGFAAGQMSVELAADKLIESSLDSFAATGRERHIAGADAASAVNIGAGKVVEGRVRGGRPFFDGPDVVAATTAAEYGRRKRDMVCASFPGTLYRNLITMGRDVDDKSFMPL